MDLTFSYQQIHIISVNTSVFQSYLMVSIMDIKEWRGGNENKARLEHRLSLQTLDHFNFFMNLLMKLEGS